MVNNSKNIILGNAKKFRGMTFEYKMCLWQFPHVKFKQGRCNLAMTAKLNILHCLMLCGGEASWESGASHFITQAVEKSPSYRPIGGVHVGGVS